MLNNHAVALAGSLILAASPVFVGTAQAGEVEDDSKFNLLLRNAYINRDFKDGVRDRAEWGQAVIGKFSSGFTPGLIGLGVDAHAMLAVRLDGGRGRSGAGGIDFFKHGDSGKAADDISKAGGAVKMRFSNTVISYGDQMPNYPVLSYADTRLLPETYTGTSVVSKEITGLELNLARFHAESRKSEASRDSGLKSINVLGGSYSFNDNLSTSLFFSDVEDQVEKQYLNVNYVLPIEKDSSLKLDFNGYKTKLDSAVVDRLNTQGDDNKIWSLAATYSFGSHSVTVAHQRSSGDSLLGYPYGGYQNAGGIGDGGSTVWLANSYWSDFNAADERSWQLGYVFDFAAVGIPGLTYNFAYVRGTDITTRDSTGGTEREIFNQIKYIVQSGPAKDLTFRARSSILRISEKSSDYNIGGNEVRVFVEYPLSIF